jgi:hypothetical protein
MPRTVVIAWVNQDQSSDAFGRTGAAVWKNNATAKDLRLARHSVAEQNSRNNNKLFYRIFVFHSDVLNPLERARVLIHNQPI